MYYEYVICDVDDVICFSDEPIFTTNVIQSKLKLKVNTIEEPDMYLGAELSKMTNFDSQECWAVSSDKYREAEVTHTEYV